MSGTLPGGGFVRLDAECADDLSVVNAARVSFGKRTEEMTSAEVGLINFLMRERHGSPFEHNFFRFHVKAPIFVVREWFRHRIGWSYNEMSGRYTELLSEGWVPRPEEVRSQVGKPGSYTFEPVSPAAADIVVGEILLAYEQSWETYERLLSSGVAKEVARTVLPVGNFTEFYASCNARSLMAFCSLRNHPNAQAEIRAYAQVLEDSLAEFMPVTYAAFVENDRQSP
jgi:thymidylate synthase (FAD)